MGGMTLVEQLNCLGCGVIIQTDDKDAIGYAPKSSLKNEDVLCRRCFRLKHYNEIEDVDMTDDDFLTMISTIAKTDSLIVHLIDIFDASGSMIHNLSNIIGKNQVILVGNKVDLLPKSTNQNRLKNWLRKTAKDLGIKIEDVFLISSTKGHGVEELTDALEHLRKQRDVYVVGMTNVGKSTFINKIINRATGEKDLITTSYFPGTTLGFIEIPLSDKQALIDTPGIINREQMSHYVSEKDLKLITPKKEVKPRVFQINCGQTLFLGGLGRVDFIKGDRQSFVCYFANQVPIHRTKTENADNLYKEHLGKLLSPPDARTMEILPELTRHSFKVASGRKDIVFPGLGWISLIEGDATVEVHSPKNVNVSVREALI